MASTGYTPWSVTAGEQPTTAYWNILGGNDASFNTGNGFNDGILVSRHFSAGSALTSAMKPNYMYVHGTLNNGTTGRSTLSASGVFPGCTVSYTTGTTNEVIFISVSGLILSSTAANGIGISANGTLVSDRTYEGETANTYQSRTVTTFFNASANTAYTIGIYAYIETGTLNICNATTDNPQGYDPKIMLMSWGR